MNYLRKRLRGFNRVPRLTATLVLLVMALSLMGAQAALATPGAWSFTDSLGVWRASQTDTLLPSGHVLLAGGESGPNYPPLIVALAQLYNPVLHAFLPAGSMKEPRKNHGATLLTSGKVLVTGGVKIVNGSPYTIDSAELYDPSGGFTYTLNGMTSERESHTASLLLDGQVLVAGGWTNPGATRSAELYNPLNERFTPTIGIQGVARYDAKAVTLLNGQVLIMGGRIDDGSIYDPATAIAELYDPVSQTFSRTGVDMCSKRREHTATLLPDGRVLVTGGQNDLNEKLDSAEIFYPEFGSFAPTLHPMTAKRVGHTATLLANGKVLLAGGANDSGALLTAEIFDPASQTFTPTGPMALKRYSHTATRLSNGQVLAAGGVGGSNGNEFRAELYDPAPPPQVKLPPLLAFYPFEGNFQDVSGNGRHGTVSGAPQLTTGYEGQAYLFNGATDYLTINLNINPTQYPRLTMGGWAKTVSGWPLQQLITHDNGDFDRSIGIDLRGNGVGWSAFCGAAGQVLGARPAYVGAWTFVAATYDQIAQTVTLQVDDYTITKSGVTLGPGQSQLYIGASPQFSSFFAGAIDNIFVYGDALTDQQLAYIRSGGAQAIKTAARKANPGISLLLMD